MGFRHQRQLAASGFVIMIGFVQTLPGGKRMQDSYGLSITLVDRSISSVAESVDLAVEWGPWAVDESGQACSALSARNQRVGERLQALLPALRSIPVQPGDLADVVGTDADPETMIRRFHRYRVLAGRWSRGPLLIRVYDRLLVAQLTIEAAAVEKLGNDAAAGLGEVLATLLAALESATGFQVWDEQGRRVLAASAAAPVLLAQHARGLAIFSRALRKTRRMRSLGVPSALLMTCGTLLIAFLIIRGAFAQGTLAARTDPARQETFVTAVLPPPVSSFGVFTGYALDGWIAESPQQLRVPVGRAEYIRAAPGARFTVLATSDRATPFVLRSAFEDQGAFLRLGDRGVSWSGLLAGVPLLLWLRFVCWPWVRARGEQRRSVREQMTRRLILVGKLIGLGALLLLLRLWA